MWKILGQFVFAETVGPALNRVGEALGSRLARKFDPEGAELERLAILANMPEEEDEDEDEE